MNYEEMQTNPADFEFANSLLTAEEFILWTGKPGKGRLFSASDAFVIPFSIFWCGFALFWELMALSSGAPPFFALFGLPFVLIGLYLLFGRFLHTAILRRKTFYVITTKRLICKKGNRLSMLSGSDLPPMQMILYQNGFGSITFGEEGYTYRRSRHYRIAPVFTLDNIPDAVTVQKLLQDHFPQA